MKLYECLKKVIEEKKIFKIEIKSITGSSRTDILHIERGNLFAWVEDKFSIYATNLLFVIVYEDIEILDPTLEENKPYYEALGRVINK